MINVKNKLLSSVVNSKHGIHLTTYIKFDGNILRFRKTLNELLVTANQHLSPVMSAEEKKRFLKPLHDLGFDAETLKKFKGNIGIFRKNDFFRYISLPTEIEETCIVADSFHIKPLIKWAQQDQDFILVGLTFEGANIFKGSQSDFKKIETAIYPESLQRLDNDGGYLALKDKRIYKKELQHTMEWLAALVEELTMGHNLTVFVAGNHDYVKAFIKSYKSDKLYPETTSPFFSESNVYDLCKNIRAILRLDASLQFHKILQEFELAQKLKTAKTNIFQIAKDAVKGNVKKLVIAEDFSVFGKINPLNGGVSVYAVDKDHEDDCLLDDLAQLVLLKGGEVVVAKRNEIPLGRPIMAILYHQKPELYTDLSTQQKSIAL
jgi:hypothetical protein